MSVENYFLSHDGRNLINKICNFLESLIIKVDIEAKSEETKETYLKWIQYKHAYEKNDDIYNYEYTSEDIRQANISIATENAKNLLDKDSVFKLCQKNDNDARTLLEYLRNKCIYSYEEKNSYYAQFQGKPRPGQEIYIKNRDDELGEPILITDVTSEKYPKTFEYLYVEGGIRSIREDHPDYYYLFFIDNPISVYVVRNSQRYSILYYNKSILNETELYNFFNCYNKTRAYIDCMVYVYGYENRYPMYQFLIEILLLQGTVSSFFNMYMDNYILSNYSDQEIYDILDSYNLSSLKKVNIGTLRKIIRDLPDLIEIKGSDLVIEKILDVVADDSVTIKRYYLQKIYNTDAEYQTEIDTTKPYDKNVDIVFKDKIIRKGAVGVEESTQDYHTFVESDDTWGGNSENLSSEQKYQIKEKFRKEILQMDFSNILTKYLTISAAVDSYSKQIELHNMMGLVWQFCRQNEFDNFLTNDNIVFDSYTIRPIDLYALICRLHTYMNGTTLENSDIINSKNMNIDDILILRNIDGTSSVYENIINGKAVIQLPENLGTKKVIDIIGSQVDDFNEYLVNFSTTTSLETIMSEYDKNALIISKIHDKWVDSSTLEESMAWEYMMEQNRTNKYYYILFDNYKTFTEFLNDNAFEFSMYVNYLLSEDDFGIAAAGKLLNRATTTFANYIKTKTDDILELYPFDSGDSGTDAVSYMKDLTILFNEFLSIYTELHKIEYSQSISDYPYNKMRLLYHFTAELIDDKYGDHITTDMRQTKSIFENTLVDELIKFVVKITDTVEDVYYDYIRFYYELVFDDIIYDYFTNLKIEVNYKDFKNELFGKLDDFIKLYYEYEESDISITLFVEEKVINFVYEYVSEELDGTFGDKISLKEKLISDIVYDSYSEKINISNFIKENIKNI